jgi:hypothetical protein
MKRLLMIGFALGLLAAGCTREKNVYLPPLPVPAEPDTGLGRHVPTSEQYDGLDCEDPH